MKTAINPTREQNYPEWYQQVIKAADLAEVSPVRGCMTIKPWGYGIWENIQHELNSQLKATGHKNLYFPLLIPASFLEKEADHIEGFAKECAVVTHHRLEKNAEGKLVPQGKLEDPYIIRPTSETIIGEAFSRWIQSYRDLPILVNQWANVFRWEMRTRLFLRTSEFLWQEGHTAHATSAEAKEESLNILSLYRDFVETYLAMPVIVGEKSASERFPGANNTYCIEAMMQDKKALQAGTSHDLGQNFSKAFNIKFLNSEGREEFAYTTSWGVSTRLVGGLIMMHSDDDGLVLPPKIAPLHVVILPLIHKEEQRSDIMTYCKTLCSSIRSMVFNGKPIEVELDTRELTGGEKAWSWVKKGVPIRLEIGHKELSARNVFMGRRDKPYKEKQSLSAETFLQTLVFQLEEMQANIFAKAKHFLDQNTRTINSKDEFYEFFKETEGGFALAHWCGDPVIEEQLKRDLNVTLRCIPHDRSGPGECIFHPGEASSQRVIFAKAY